MIDTSRLTPAGCEHRLIVADYSVKASPLLPNVPTLWLSVSPVSTTHHCPCTNARLPHSLSPFPCDHEPIWSSRISLQCASFFILLHLLAFQCKDLCWDACGSTIANREGDGCWIISMVHCRTCDPHLLATAGTKAPLETLEFEDSNWHFWQKRVSVNSTLFIGLCEAIHKNVV